MKSRLQKQLHFIIFACIAACMLIAGWKQTITHPNDYLFSSGGDAIKNYFTPAWYVKYDDGLHFTGMLYPYGEHVVFTDNQPALTWMINWVDNHVCPVNQYTIGILHIAMLLSFFLGIIFLYKILLYYQMPSWYAAIIALCIGLMTPQSERLWGHYALTYAMFIPVVWWQMIQCQRTQFYWRHLVTTVLVVVFFGCIHMYYTLIAAMFIGFYGIAVWVRARSNWKHAVLALVTAALPVVLIMLFIRTTDSVTDRPDSPWGFFRYKATFQSVFLPRSGAFGNQVRKMFHLSHGDMEGYAYVGLAGLIFLIVLAVVWTKRYLHTRSISRTGILMPGNMSPFIWASVGTLIFSMALPFSLGLQFLLDILPPLKQFRSPGRFAWVFYYVYLVAISVLAWMLYKKIKKRYKVLSVVFITAYCILFMIDAGIYYDKITTAIQHGNARNPFGTENNPFNHVLADTQYKPDDFDALLYVPAFYIGSEKMLVDRSGGYGFQAMEAAYALHLPLMDAMLSRTSYQQTFDAMLMVSHPFMPMDTSAEIFSHFPKGKILLMVKKELVFTRGEKYIMEHVEIIKEAEGFTFCVMDIQDIKAKGTPFAKSTFIAERDSLKSFSTPYGSYMSVHPAAVYYYNDFEHSQLPEGDGFLGSRGISLEESWTPIAEIPVSVEQPIWVEASVWAWSDPESITFPYMLVILQNEQGAEIGRTAIEPKGSVDILQDWVRASTDFEVGPAVRKIVVMGGDKSAGSFDELMVRHSGWNTYHDIVSADSFIINNIPVGK